MTFAELKALKKRQQEEEQRQQQQQQQQEAPKSPRSLQVYDARPLSPRPVVKEASREEETQEELEEQIRGLEAEAERMQKKLSNMEASAKSEEERLVRLREEAKGETSEHQRLVAEVKSAHAELAAEKEKLARTRQQKEKGALVLRGMTGGLEGETQALKEQLAEESGRGKALAAELDAATEASFRLEQAVERGKTAAAESLARKTGNEPTTSRESDEVLHYRAELEKAKARLAQENEKIALLAVTLEGEIRSNRAMIDEREADFLRQIAKLKSQVA